MRPAFLLTLGYLLITRIGELVLSRRNLRSILARGGRRVEDDGLGPLVAVHVAWMLGLLLEELGQGPPILTPGTRGLASAVFLLAEFARYWCMHSLGDRWTMQVIVVDGDAPVTDGPYRWIRHPNYLAVVISVAALPLALGRPWSAALGVPLTLLALRKRIRVENGALYPEK